MRKLSFSTTRTSALTERLTSPFLRNPSTGTPDARTTGNAGWRSPSGNSPMTDRDYADAAIRLCRTLW